MSKRVRRLGIVGIVAILGISLGAGVYLRAGEHTLYKTAKVQRGDIESTISATGTCNAVVTVLVGSQVSGNIKELYANFNTKVTKGQIVAKIDPELFQAKVNQAKANRESAEASVANMRATIERAQADAAGAVAEIKSAEANIAKAKVAVIDARSKLKARTELVASGAISSEELETAKATYDSAVASAEAADSALQAARAADGAANAQVAVTRTQLLQAQAQVKQMSASVAQAELDLEHCEILAPVDGVVVARRMDVGQTVAASFQAPTLFEIAQDLTKMQVDTNVDEADVGRVKVAQKAFFTVDAYPGMNFKGEVVEIRKAPINTQNVVTYDVVVAVSNPEFKLFPGMTANVQILTDQHKDILKVPNGALRFRPVGDTPAEAQRAGGRGEGARKGSAGGAHKLWRVGLDGKPVPVEVKTGISDGTFTAITSEEVKEGDEVIVGNATKPGTTAAPAGGLPRRGLGL